MKDILTLFKQVATEKKANEVMHTGNTGYGAEFVPDPTFVKGIIDILPQYSALLPLLPGNHGSNLPKSVVKAARGLTVSDVLFKKRTEWTTGRSSDAEAKHSQSKAGTMKVQLDQKGFICEIDLSDDDIRYSSDDLETYVKGEIARGMALTIDGVLINSDTASGATGNVNSDDQAAATTLGADHYSLVMDGGIRKKAIAGSYTKNSVRWLILIIWTLLRFLDDMPRIQRIVCSFNQSRSRIKPGHSMLLSSSLVQEIAQVFRRVWFLHRLA